VKLRNYIFIILLCSCAGVFFFLLQQRWLIIHWNLTPFSDALLAPTTGQSTQQKTIKIFYWNHEKWNSDEVSIIWHEDNTTNNLQHIIKQWLMTLQDERLIPPHVTLESVALSSSGNEAYVSFDRSFLNPEQPIINKWRILDGFFKTLLHAQMHIQTITFLVKQKPMDDDHLDFSQPVPVQERLIH